MALKSMRAIKLEKGGSQRKIATKEIRESKII